MVWLYVGGLVADVTAAALAERFAAFGTVRDCQLPADKPVHGATDIPARGFGFVDLDETDETSLRRCISLVSTTFLDCASYHPAGHKRYSQACEPV